MTIADRLRGYIKANGLTVKDFERLSEIPYRTLQDYLMDKRQPGAAQLARMCEAGVDLNWLITGKFVGAPLSHLFNKAEAGVDASVIGADLKFMELISLEAETLTQKLCDAYSTATGTRPNTGVMLMVFTSYITDFIKMTNAMSENFESLRKKGVDREMIVEILSSSLNSSDKYKDPVGVIKKLQDSLTVDPSVKPAS